MGVVTFDRPISRNKRAVGNKSAAAAADYADTKETANNSRINYATRGFSSPDIESRRAKLNQSDYLASAQHMLIKEKKSRAESFS